MPDISVGPDNRSGWERFWDDPFGEIGKMVNKMNGTEANNQFAADEAGKARAFNSAEAEKARNFEAFMSNTAYQRGTKDMLAAGLNPAAIGGNAASTPSGQPATASAAQASSSTSGILGVIGRVASAAIAGSLARKIQNTARVVAGSSSAKQVRAISQEATSAYYAAKKSQIDEILKKNFDTEMRAYKIGLDEMKRRGLSPEDLGS